MTRDNLALALLYVGTVAIAFVLGANLFEMVICAPGWRSPGGIDAWRSLTAKRNAGIFFLPLAISSLLCFIAGTALGWNHPAERNPFALGAASAVLVAMILTGTYLVPRAVKIFVGPALDPAESARLLDQFLAVNRVRVAVAFAGLVSALVALRR
jgi:hypothetical protein